MAGNLITPRVEVFWDDINLTSYNGKQNFPQGEPLVFAVDTNFQSQSSGPTASLSWNPTGPAAEVYEELLSTKTDKTLTIKWYYAEGKYLLSKWVWAGQSVSYGNNMSIKVSLLSELAGVVNASTRSIAQVHNDPNSYYSGNKLLHKAFAVDDKYSSLSPAAKKVMESATYSNHYGKDTTFGASLANLGGSAGVFYTPTNIDESTMVGFVPFTGEDDEEVLDGSTVQPGKSPDPTKRYGYLLGPSLISSMERTTNWKPPQQTNGPVTSTRPRVESKQSLKQAGINSQTATPAPVKSTQNSYNQPTASPIGTSTSLNLNVTPAKNEKGVELNELKNKEQGSELTFTTYMVPVLTGLKPNDIVYIPSLTGKYIEDWIVQTITYTQIDGAVTINVNATRVYGLTGLMQEKPGAYFKKKAAGFKTLEDWQNYAWSGLRGNTSGNTDVGGNTFGADPSVPAYTGKTLNTQGKVSPGGIF